MLNKKESDSEFAESSIEKEFKSMDLNMISIKKRNSFNIQIPSNFRNIQNIDSNIISNDDIEENDMNILNEEFQPLFNRNLSSGIDNININEENNDKLPLSTLIFYSLPSFGKMSCLVLLNVNSTLYYESLGASLIYMSFFVILSRSIEILLKPLIAHISDEIKTKMGRRKPFMLIGCGFYALFLVLLFSPPSVNATQRGLSIWYGVFFVLFFMAESVTIPPYLALAPELSYNSHEREKLYYFFYVFQYVGVLFAAAAPILINKFFNECDCSYCVNFPLQLDIEKCIESCNLICNLRNNEKSFLILSTFIGIFFIVSIILLSLNIQEKQGSFNKEKFSFIPSLNQMINNKPFLSMIIPWMCDMSIMTIFSSMLPFFLNAVINPQQYCRQNKISLKNKECTTDYYLGLSISLFFICCIASCSLWHFLVEKYGKVFCWKMYSLISILPFTLFLFCDIGSTNLLVISAIFTSFPTGGAYLNDVLISDVIEYDEFLTGKRAEGIFTVFSSLIPKFVSLFAQAIPLSILSLIGFIPTEKGYVHMQPNGVIYYIKFVFAVIPIFLSVISFLYKMKYPISDNLNKEIKKGIEIQKSKFAIMKRNKINYYKLMDPVYKTLHVNIIINNESGKNILMTKDLCEHFINKKDLLMIYNNNLENLKYKLKKELSGFIVLTTIFFVLIFFSFNLLSNQKYSFIPIADVFAITFLIIFDIFWILKIMAVNKAIKKEFIADKKFVKLFIFYKIANNNI